MTVVEIIEPTKRVRLKKDNGSPYIGKRKFIKEIGRSPMTVGKWECFLIRYVADFRKYFQPRKAWNYYQVWCFELVNNYWESLPSSAPAEAIRQYIEQNANLFSEENYFNELKSTISRESSIVNARAIEAA